MFYVGTSGFYLSSLADDTFSSITAINGQAQAQAAGTLPTGMTSTCLQDMPTQASIVALEVLCTRSGTFTMPAGASVEVDLFRGSAGQLPIKLGIMLDGPLQYTTGASFSAYKTLDPPIMWAQQNLATYTTTTGLEALFSASYQGSLNATNAIYGRVKVKAGGALTFLELIVHWEKRVFGG